MEGGCLCHVTGFEIVLCWCFVNLCVPTEPDRINRMHSCNANGTQLELKRNAKETPKFV